MKSKIHFDKINKGRLLLLLIGGFLAFISFLYSCSGAIISEERRIALVKDQPYEGVQKTLDYVLEYRYVFEQKNPQLTGNIKLTASLKPRRGLDMLHVYINFLDSEGKIIGTKSIYGTGVGHGAGKASIENQFETPPETVAIAFSWSSQERRQRGGE
jgi:hypothetical protein